MLNIGSAIGPAVGSMLYGLVGFQYMFMIIGSLFLIFIPLLKLTMPEGIDDNDEATLELVQNESLRTNTNIEKVSHSKLFLDPVILLALVSQVLLGISFSYVEPVLSFRLLDFTTSVSLQGLFF